MVAGGETARRIDRSRPGTSPALAWFARHGSARRTGTHVSERSTQPDPYLAEHLREALAQDPRVGELGVTVELRGDRVVLYGTVTSAERGEAAAAVARELMPGHTVSNETEAADCPEPEDEEHFP